MYALRSLFAGAVIGVAVALAALNPASASAASDPSMADRVSATQVTGESWSSPAYPVNCVDASGQISCTPTDPAEVTAQQCYRGVLYRGTSTTVCTTFKGHTQALQNAGGTNLLVEYGCQLGDVVCLTFENAGRALALAATGMMFVVADNMRFDTTTVLWHAAVGQWSFWQWAILIITFGAMVWAIAAAVVSGERNELVSAIVRSFIAIPAVPLTLWLTGHLLNTVDDMTWYILQGGGPTRLFSTLQSVMWAGGQANYFFAFLIHGLLMLGMLLLMLVFAFRNIVLAALIMVGPVAWMLFPARGVGPQWVVRYVSAVVVLLLTGPLTIGFVALIINGLANVKTIWNPQSWPLLVGLVMVAFAPFAIFGLFSFAGAVAVDSVGSRLGSHGGRLAASAARSAARVPARLSGRPSGIRPPGGSPVYTTSASRPASSTVSPSGAHGGARRSAQAQPAMKTSTTQAAPQPARATSSAAIPSRPTAVRTTPSASIPRGEGSSS